jgi:ribosomal protein S12 methylthiotransferase accessory factor
MKIKTFVTGNQSISPKINNIVQKVHSPLVGLCQEIGYLKRSAFDAALIVIGGELTGVHHILKRPDPGKGGYHIGGVGYFHDEALIKTVAESLERYSQLFSEYKIKDRLPRKFLPYHEMKEAYANVIPEVYLTLFDASMFSKTGFPFDQYDSLKPITWVEVAALDQNSTMWIPAQFLFLGFTPDRMQEPWLLSSVTTGTAAHTTKAKAIISGVSELTQIDAAMGHWYTDQKAKRLILDDRVKVFKSFMTSVIRSKNLPLPTFYSLESKDLPGFNIACVWKKGREGSSAFAVGLGSDYTLENALYKAFLEGQGVVGLGRLSLFKKMNMPGSKNGEGLYDLDSNVALYAEGNNAAYFRSKFGDHSGVKTEQLPQDWSFENDEEMVAFLVRSFKQAGKDLFYIDLTTTEAEELGLHIARIYSPNMLSLCLPGCVPKLHPRFKDYSGTLYDIPHPYP